MAKRVTKTVAKKVAAAKRPPAFVDEPDVYEAEFDDPKPTGPNWPILGLIAFCLIFWYAVLRYFGIL
jgi:hypothetical protein